MTDEEVEAYLRKHTLLGQMKEVHDAGAILVRFVTRDISRLLLKILNVLGI
jgi:hypothetical protein